MDPSFKLSPDALDHLHHPPTTPFTINDPTNHHSITYLALENSSQVAYEAITCSFQHNFPGVPGVGSILTFYNVKKLIRTYTSVELILNDMCPNTCLAFTGPFSGLDECLLCQSS